MPIVDTDDPLVSALPVDLSVRNFLEELNKAIAESNINKPLIRRGEWNAKRDRKIAEIVRKYTNIEPAQTLALVESNVLPDIKLEVLETAGEQLIRQTCIEEREKEKRREEERLKIRYNFEKIVPIKQKDGSSQSGIRLLLKKDDRLSFSEALNFYLGDAAIFTDVTVGEPMVFIARRAGSGSGWVSKVEFHVHSQDDLNCLLE